MENSPQQAKEPLSLKNQKLNKELRQGADSSKAFSKDLAENRKAKVKKEISRFPKNLPPSTRRALQFFRITTLALNFIVHVLYMLYSNPIKPYIKTLNQALGIDAQLSSFVFSLPNLFSLFTGVPANMVLTRFGQKACMYLNLIIVAIGFGFRYFIEESFTYYIIGSIIVGIGLPFGYNMCLVVCAEWFDTKHVSFEHF